MMGDGSEEFSPIDLCFHPRSLMTFLQNAVSKSWGPVALSGLEVLSPKQPGFQHPWHGSRVSRLDKWAQQLVTQAFCSYRINLSPFTKDFRGQEAKIEHSSIFLRLPFGSCYSAKLIDKKSWLSILKFWGEKLICGLFPQVEMSEKTIKADENLKV